MKGEEILRALGAIGSRYASGIVAQPWFALAFAGLAVALVHPEPRRWLSARPRAAKAVLAVVIAAGSWHAWSLLWASDDAYISFRYARNLQRGQGLVFNPGERVEGYTDFLWTVMMAVPIALGIDPGLAAILVSLTSFAAPVLLASRLASRLSPGVPVVVGLGPLLLVASYTVASFATSALETVFAAMLALLAVERAEAGRPLQSGLASVAAAMSHPDHAIFSVVLGGALLTMPERRKALPAFIAPFVLVFAPYFLWRWSYYGDLMPNTYYAKSASKAYFDQGAIYAAVTLTSAGLLAAAPLAVGGLWSARRSVSSRFAMVAIPLFVVYVMKVGGDFMMGRLFTSVIAFTFVFADVGLRHLLSKARYAAAAALAAVTAVGAYPVAVIAPGEIFHGIADERTFTSISDFRRMTARAAGYDLGLALHREFTEHGLAPRFALFSIGMAGYYSDVPVFDLRGLTSRSVAHLPIHRRGRPGHEKLASVGHLLEAGVDLSEIPFYPAPYDALGKLHVGGFGFSVRAEDPELLRRLPPGVEHRSFGARIDRSLSQLGASGPDRLMCDLWHMKEYYFSRNPGDARRQAVAEAAVRSDPSLDGVREWLLDVRGPEAKGWKKLLGFSFEPGESSWDVRGDAEGVLDGPAVPEQDQPFGFEGRFVDTFTRAKGDEVQVTLTSPEFAIEGELLTFRIGGGHDAAGVSLSLMVDGAPVRTATGCSSEWMDRRIWDVRPFRGMRGKLVISDASTRGWGHLLVDEIGVWRAP